MPLCKIKMRPRQKSRAITQHEQIAKAMVAFVNADNTMEEAGKVVAQVGVLLRVGNWREVVLDNGLCLIEILDKSRRVVKGALQVIFENQGLGEEPTAHLNHHGSLIRLIRASDDLNIDSVQFGEGGAHVVYRLANMLRAEALIGRLTTLFLTSEALTHVKQCGWCRTYFYSRRTDARFCTDSCRARNSIHQRKIKEENHG